MTDSIFTFRFQKPDEERLDHFLVESLPDYSRAPARFNQGWLGFDQRRARQKVRADAGT